MSFGYSVADLLGLAQLAWKTVQNTRRACGEHDELTREVTNLHFVLRRVQNEASRSDSIFQRTAHDTKEELRIAVEGCGRILRILDTIVVKYNSLTDEERAGKKLWSKIRFGNGEMGSLSELRLKLLTYTSGITLLLNLISMGSQGRVEQQMDSQGSDLRGIRQSLNWITASLSSGNEGSILTTYSGDDKAVWKDLRRELVSEGYSSNLIAKHKVLIMEYVKELGERGALDDIYASDELLLVAKFDTNLVLTATSTASPSELDRKQSSGRDDHATEEESIQRKSFDEGPMDGENIGDQDVEKRDIEGQDVEEQNVEERNVEEHLAQEEPMLEESVEKQRVEEEVVDSKPVTGHSLDGDLETGSLHGDSLVGNLSERLEYSGEHQVEPSISQLKADSNPEGVLNDSSEHQKQLLSKCKVCGSIDNTIVLASCQHTWCDQCAMNALVKSLSSTEDMPPKCCKRGSIDLFWLKHGNYVDLSRLDFERMWKQKFEEYTAERLGVYCARKGCGQYIERAPSLNFTYRTVRKLSCPRCHKSTCRVCNFRSCPGDGSCISWSSRFFGWTDEDRAEHATRCKEMGSARDAEQIAEMQKKYWKPIEIQNP